jgi:AcrR family transcriptional regulator
MPGKEEIRERIIESAAALIEESGGDVTRIPARSVAARAGVALGLINYYFGSKEKLVAECVARIIRRVILGFDTSKSYPDDARASKPGHSTCLRFFSNIRK